MCIPRILKFLRNQLHLAVVTSISCIDVEAPIYIWRLMVHTLFKKLEISIWLRISMEVHPRNMEKMKKSHFTAEKSRKILDSLHAHEFINYRKWEKIFHGDIVVCPSGLATDIPGFTSSEHGKSSDPIDS